MGSPKVRNPKRNQSTKEDLTTLSERGQRMEDLKTLVEMPSATETQFRTFVEESEKKFEGMKRLIMIQNDQQIAQGLASNISINRKPKVDMKRTVKCAISSNTRNSSNQFPSVMDRLTVQSNRKFAGKKTLHEANYSRYCARKTSTTVQEALRQLVEELKKADGLKSLKEDNSCQSNGISCRKNPPEKLKSFSTISPNPSENADPTLLSSGDFDFSKWSEAEGQLPQTTAKKEKAESSKQRRSVAEKHFPKTITGKERAQNTSAKKRQLPSCKMCVCSRSA